VRNNFPEKNSQKWKNLYKEKIHRINFMYEDELEKKKPIEYNRFIDKFVLEAPNGETYYFRDYEGAEDFFLLNFDVAEEEDLALL